MPLRRNLFSGKRKYGFGVALLLSISLICLAFSMDSDGFDASRREVLLRRLGHELLLQSGDPTSRVLPVKATGENSYQISFEKALAFNPDSLVATTRRLLGGAPGRGDYIVNVLACGGSGVAYGYAISGKKADDIIACTRRVYPRACYRINITFKPAGIITAKLGYLLGGLPVLAFIGFLFYRSAKPRRTPPAPPDTDTFTLGAVLFDPKGRTLLLNGQTTDLTGTESRVLHLFALAPNEVIERSRLQKEIWEDQGVIVGRSLDMFISKLRKKLEGDPSIKIVVVRGKGYKLEISG